MQILQSIFDKRLEVVKEKVTTSLKQDIFFLSPGEKNKNKWRVIS